MRIRENQATITKLELNSGCRAIESNAKGVFYFADDDKKAIAIFTARDGIAEGVALTKKQAYALLDEFADICEMVFE